MLLMTGSRTVPAQAMLPQSRHILYTTLLSQILSSSTRGFGKEGLSLLKQRCSCSAYSLDVAVKAVHVHYDSGADD